MANNDGQILIKKRIRRHVDDEVHGTWKIAYADFVTALMAFFALMWLISLTNTQNPELQSEYFNPYIAEESETSRPQGGVISLFDGGMMGGSDVERRAPENAANPSNNDDVIDKNNIEGLVSRNDLEEWRDEIERLERENEKLNSVRESLYRIMEEMGIHRDIQDSVVIDRIPEGLRIQVVDKEGFSMFSRGSIKVTERGKDLMDALAIILKRIPNEIAISGHTDSTPFRGDGSYSNWELSSDRAHTARKELSLRGIGDDRINRVEGFSDKRPYVKEDHYADQNRRVSLLLLNDMPAVNNPASETQNATSVEQNTTQDNDNVGQDAATEDNQNQDSDWGDIINKWSGN